MERKRPADRSAIWEPPKSVRLFVDDLDEIFTILSGLSGTVVAETDEYKGITSAAELLTIDAPTIRSLRIVGGDDTRRVTVTLASGLEDSAPAAQISVSVKDNNDLHGASLRIRDVLISRQRILGGRISNFIEYGSSSVVVPLALIAYVLVTIFNDKRLSSNYNWVWALLVFFTPLIVATAWGVRAPNRRPSADIILKRRAEAPTYWERNGTTVTISLITNAIVAVASFLAGKAFN